MSYTEQDHPHQSEQLAFLLPDYAPLTVGPDGTKTYGVIGRIADEWVVFLSTDMPTYGGYLARESYYGSPTYCANATKHHKKHQEQYGNMPHLVFFDSSKSAELAGFAQCQRCSAT